MPFMFLVNDPTPDPLVLKPLILHKSARLIPAHVDEAARPNIVWHLPLCWQASIKERGMEDLDDAWNLAWDHEAIDPFSLAFAVRDEHVNCTDCLEWMHA